MSVKVPFPLGEAVTIACSRWGNKKAAEWICWVLPERLAGHLALMRNVYVVLLRAIVPGHGSGACRKQLGYIVILH